MLVKCTLCSANNFMCLPFTCFARGFSFVVVIIIVDVDADVVVVFVIAIVVVAYHDYYGMKLDLAGVECHLLEV